MQDRGHRKIRSRQAQGRKQVCVYTIPSSLSLYMIRSNVQFLLFLDYILLCIHVLSNHILNRLLLLALWHHQR